jgi:hypothetical protein
MNAYAYGVPPHAGAGQQDASAYAGAYGFDAQQYNAQARQTAQVAQQRRGDVGAGVDGGSKRSANEHSRSVSNPQSEPGSQPDASAARSANPAALYGQGQMGQNAFANMAGMGSYPVYPTYPGMPPAYAAYPVQSPYYGYPQQGYPQQGDAQHVSARYQGYSGDQQTPRHATGSAKPRAPQTNADAYGQYGRGQFSNYGQYGQR